MGSIDDLKHLSLNGSFNGTNGTNGTKNQRSSNGTSRNHIQQLDALVVGAGFGGVYQLKALRDAGYSVKLVEAGSDYGGVWYWNRYPGARVDSAIPHYEFSDPALWKDWTWKQRFPGGEELRAYFKYVAKKWDLRKDTQFNSFVESARWSNEEARWTVKTKGGDTFKVKFLLLNTGFAAKKYIPDWKGIESFKGMTKPVFRGAVLIVTRNVPSPFTLARTRARPARQESGCYRHRLHWHSNSPGAEQSRWPAYGLPTHAKHVLANGPSRIHTSQTGSSQIRIS